MSCALGTVPLPRQALQVSIFGGACISAGRAFPDTVRTGKSLSLAKIFIPVEVIEFIAGVVGVVGFEPTTR